MPQVSGGWEHTPVDGPLPTTRLPNSRSICTSQVAGKMATTSKIGCVPRKNSYGVTRNCEVPRNKQGALNGVAQTWTGLSISTKDLSNISNGPIIFFPAGKRRKCRQRCLVACFCPNQYLIGAPNRPGDRLHRAKLLRLRRKVR